MIKLNPWYTVFHKHLTDVQLIKKFLVIIEPEGSTSSPSKTSIKIPELIKPIENFKAYYYLSNYEVHPHLLLW
jgi:hypothetical protein